jgi:hypothetical protein
MSLRRIQRGKWHSYTDDGRKVPGVTTLLGAGVPKPALVGWAGRVVAETAVELGDELARLGDGAAAWLQGAPNRIRDAQADKGRTIHDICAGLAQGLTVDVPAEVAGYVDAYLTWQGEWLDEVLAVERPIINRRLWYAGTFDLIARLRTGKVALVDAKTGDSGIWPETCLQVAAYRAAEHMLDDDGVEVPMIPTDAGYGLWLTETGYQFHPLASGPAELKIFAHAAYIGTWLKRDRDELVGQPVDPPALEAVS